MGFTLTRNARSFFEVELFGVSWFYFRIGDKGLCWSPDTGLLNDWRMRD
ncbi:MAG TPA: hypothetical protein VGL25_19820 [Casimicrobiaceae bacterium]